MYVRIKNVLLQENDDEELFEDELFEWKREFFKVDFFQFDFNNFELMLQVFKKGRILMMFVIVLGSGNLYCIFNIFCY